MNGDKISNGEINFYDLASLSDSFKTRTVNINSDWQSVINSPFNTASELESLGKKLVLSMMTIIILFQMLKLHH